MGAVFGIFTGISVYWPSVSKLFYNMEMIQAFFNQFFIGVNLTFFPIHFLGLYGCPRKYKEVADKYYWLFHTRTFGSTIRLVSIYFFITLYFDTIISYRIIINIGSFRSRPEWFLSEGAHHQGGLALVKGADTPSPETPSSSPLHYSSSVLTPEQNETENNWRVWKGWFMGCLRGGCMSFTFKVG